LEEVLLVDERTAMSASIRVKVLVEGALCVALSVVFSCFKLFTMPQGGSVTLDMAPLLYFAYRRGFKWGAAAGTMSGLLQMSLFGYIVHPLQAFLDYPLAFACIGAAGLFKSRPVIGAVSAGAGRCFCSIVSGVIFFASYAPEGQNPWLYSTIYNATYSIPNIILSGTVALLLWKKLEKRDPKT
jgi:thiamine transporter